MVAEIRKLDAVALAAPACYGAAVLPFVPREVSHVAASVLCFILTAFLAARAILPRQASGVAWFTATVACALGVGVIGALLLNLFPPGLTLFTWATFALLTALIAYAVARWRDPGGLLERKRPGLPAVNWFSAAKIATSVVIVAVAAAVTVSGPNSKNKPFTEVWFLPDGPAHTPVAATRAVFGMKSHESSNEQFTVVLSAGRQVTTHQVMLAPQQTWTQAVSVAGNKPVATVYRGRQTSSPYRMVWFARR